MDTDEYQAGYEGRTGADRMALQLAIIPDKLRGDMDEVARLRAALKIIRDIDFRGNRHESHFIAKRVLMPYNKLTDPEAPCKHKWIRKRAGGSPDMAESYETVIYCEHCGEEK